MLLLLTDTGGGGSWSLTRIYEGGGGYYKMTQIDTRGEGGGPKWSKKLTRIFWTAPYQV